MFEVGILCLGLFNKRASTHSFKSSEAMKLSTMPRSSMKTRRLRPTPSNTPGSCFEQKELPCGVIFLLLRLFKLLLHFACLLADFSLPLHPDPK